MTAERSHLPTVSSRPVEVRSDRIDTTRAHSARVWDYWLGGKDNYAVDRQIGDQVAETFPQVVVMARAGRAFMRRSVAYLAAEAGIRQFLDIGTGLPTEPNVHQVAQAVAPQTRVVYVDNDPAVLAHARALLTSAPEGACTYLDADLREPGKILTLAADTLDLDRPVGLLFNSILHFINDDSDVSHIAGRMLDALAPGSYLAVNHGAAELGDEGVKVSQAAYNKAVVTPLNLRTRAQITDLFFTGRGLELVEPGVVCPPRWRPDAATEGTEDDVPYWAGVARKP